ncbi:hypothetical protein G9A89_006044 [Geosiphon pyriformis]|nr:hypothetical protein G9A89_006044 [Geosiphon pyriformis]
MEVNKDEALRCLQIARTHLSSGKVVSALRFAQKSISLYPTTEAKAFLKKVEASKVPETEESEPNSPTSPFTGSSRDHNQGRQTREFTPEQAEAVKRIKACGVYEYYEVLGLNKDASDGEIKKAYKKLALLMHPDKNGAPGADEAFKKISKAFQVLNDPQKREIFDQHGADPDSRMPSPGFGNARFNGFSNGAMFADEITPEELFNMFFGGDLGGGFHAGTFVSPGFRARQYGPRRAPRNAEEGQTTPSTWLQFVQLLPLILLFLFSLSSNLFSTTQDSTPAFSLEQIPPYTQARFTHSLQIPYFVNPKDFMSFEQNPRILRRYEDAVENKYVRQLQQRCNSEKILQKQRVNEALGWYFNRNEEKLEEAKSMKMPNCERLNKLAEK